MVAGAEAKKIISQINTKPLNVVIDLVVVLVAKTTYTNILFVIAFIVN